MHGGTPTRARSRSTSSPTSSAPGATSASAGSRPRSPDRGARAATCAGRELASVPAQSRPAAPRASTAAPTSRRSSAGRSAPPRSTRASAPRARAVGIAFAFERIARQPNTLDAHRLIAWAQARGDADALVERLFRAYFLEGATSATARCWRRSPARRASTPPRRARSRFGRGGRRGARRWTARVRELGVDRRAVLHLRRPRRGLRRAGARRRWSRRSRRRWPPRQGRLIWRQRRRVPGAKMR